MIRWLALSLLGVVSLTGCASARRDTAPTPDPRGVAVWGADGLRVGWEQLVFNVGVADAALIGENHGHPLGLACAAALFEDVLTQSPDAALSLEFFERDEQSRIDDYLAGMIDEAKFRARTGRSDGNYPAGHRAMLEAAKAAKRPVIASNAPRPTTSFVGREGYERIASLTAEQRRLVRVPDTQPTDRYREEFDKLMSGMGNSHGGSNGHGVSQERLDAMFRSQSLWDWTMAESIARAAETGGRPVVHVVGRFHIDHRGGLVQALEKLLPSNARVTTISFVDADSSSLRDEDRGRADYVIYVGPTPAKRQ